MSPLTNLPPSIRAALYCARELGCVGAQHRHEVAVRIAAMQEQRFAEPDRERELPLEGAALLVRRREVAVVVEAAFAHGRAERILGEFRQGVESRRVEVDRVVRVTACGGAHQARRRVGEAERAAGALDRGPGDDELVDPRGERTAHHILAVGIVAVMREVDADVDQHGRHGHAQAVAFFGNAPSAVQSASTSSSVWSQETTKRASPEPSAPQS